MPDGSYSIADDLISGIGPVTVAVFHEDTPQNRRRIYRQFELPENQRLRVSLK